MCPAVYSGFAEALRHVGQVVYDLKDSCVRSSGFSLHFLAKNATSFSHSHIVSNSLKTRRASQQPKSFGKTVVLANAPAPVGISTSCALAMAASHPLAEKPGTWGVFEATPALEGTSLDSTTSPMVSLPPPGLLCGYLACEARSAPTAPTGSTAGAARVSPPPRTRSSPR